jgi:hypothetical protein
MHTIAGVRGGLSRQELQIKVTERLNASMAPIALSVWAFWGGSPSGNFTGGRPWQFRLVWLNTCTGQPAPCGFVLYPNNPLFEPIYVDAASQATAIKKAALVAFQKAFDKYPVRVDEGSQDTGDHRVNVINGSDIQHPCGKTDNLPGVRFSKVFYMEAAGQAQWALPIALYTALDVQNALNRADLIKAIGAGIGNNAAHELAHQFLLASYGMDDASTNTYNSAQCEGDSAPWVYGLAPIHWGTSTAEALKIKLDARPK